MKYMGSKDKIAKYIIPFLIKNREKGQWYVEPFVGGGNMIDKMDGNRIGADINEYVIEALKLIRDNPRSLPKTNKDTSESIYREIKKMNGFEKGLIGYYGFALSYGGKWFGGWRRDNTKSRDYINESFRDALNQSNKLKSVELIHSGYKTIDLPCNSIIYCDPPYLNSPGYSTGEFNHDDFWQWARLKRKEGHKMYISEYQAPDDFIDVWQIEKVSSLGKDTGSKKGREKLFVHKDDYKDQFWF